MEEPSSEKFDDGLNIEKLKSKIGFGIKFWLEIQDKDRKNILGSGWANLLECIDNTEKSEPKSLTKAAKECGYSYKYAWNILNKIKKRSGKSPVETKKGGLGGGGWVKLNDWGKYLLRTYKNLFTELEGIEKKLEKSLKID
ncbi:MAG: ModE family transcriptional regulator [Candidatus Lokiarchaeota archaeon]|nr:ModE family transcriptional regulator [Candidatus Lokiarchaeota archaeon]